MDTYVLVLESLEVVDSPGDPGSHIEPYFVVEIDALGGELYVPNKNGHSTPKKSGSTWQINQSFAFHEQVNVTLMESDSSSGDDNYGTKSFSTTPTVNGTKSFKKKDDYEFILTYSISKI
jgi:hypothetical protein